MLNGGAPVATAPWRGGCRPARRATGGLSELCGGAVEAEGFSEEHRGARRCRIRNVTTLAS